MRVCIVTPRLYVVARESSFLSGTDGKGEDEQIARIVADYEADPWRTEPDYVYLLSGHRSVRARVCHWVLRALSRFAWLPSALATPSLRLCAEEIMETLRGCNPDVVRGFDLPWAGELARFLHRRQPDWLLPAEGATRFTPRARSPMDTRSKVSIVLPTYNGVRYLRQAVESCLSQTFPNIELILVDDGSGPEVREALEPYRSDERLRYVRHERNQGVAASLNTGFRLSTGSYLTWTSDDNYYEPHAIAEMLAFFSRYPAIDFLYAESYEVNDNGGVTRLLRPGPPSSLRINNLIGACFLYKRDVYERVGDYNLVPLVEDYDYWIRVARSCRMQRLFKPLYSYRAHPASLTARHSPREVRELVTEVKRLNRFGSRRNQ